MAGAVARWGLPGAAGGEGVLGDLPGGGPLQRRFRGLGEVLGLTRGRLMSWMMGRRRGFRSGVKLLRRARAPEEGQRSVDLVKRLVGST